MKDKAGLLLLAALAMALAIVALGFFARSQSAGPDPEFRARAERYVEQLGTRPLQDLSRDEKLLLFHAYAVLDRRTDALEVWDAVSSELDDLPRERRELFENMAVRLRGQGPIAWMSVAEGASAET